MFQDLGLFVCDDGSEIDKKVKELSPRYLQMKKRPDPKGWVIADEWFKHAEAVQHRRAELIRVVYEKFVRDADTALHGSIGKGLTTLTQPLIDNLDRIARDGCRVDNGLAQQFLQDFMQERDLVLGEVLIRPSGVENFTAVGGLQKISLSWSLPSGNCDEIELAREGEVLYQGRASSFIDTSVPPGTWYTYRVYSWYQGVKSTTCATARAVCVGEVREATATWQDGRVCLSWESPGTDVSVLIFRRTGGTPSVRRGPHGPEAADTATTRVHRGAGTSWSDTEVTEGATYHYRIVAEFGHGLFSEGVVVQATVPQAPPSVSALTASYKPNVDADVVVVEWQSIPGGVPVEYVVVRREGDASPGQVEEGTHIHTTRQTRCLDEQIVAGRRYTYAIFTRVGSLYSRTGTAAPPVDVLAEVTQLQAQTGDATVELQWNTPANVSRVVVRRSLNPPRDHTDGVLVSLTGAGHAKDEGLHNDRCYHYLVCCAYRPDGTAEVCSPGVRIEAVPVRLPEPVEDFGVRAQGQEALCTWSPLVHGQVVVIRSAALHGLPVGHRLRTHELDNLEKQLQGERLVTTENGRAVDAHPDINRPHYSAFTVTGPHAVAGGTGSCVICPDVANLTLSATQDGIILRWTWPLHCTAVRVARRADTWPEGPNDPLATVVPCTHGEYAAAGEKFSNTIHEDRARFHYVVYAQVSGTAGLFFAPGTGPDCRGIIEWGPPMTLRYRMSSPGKGTHRGKDILLTWSVEQPLPHFSEFVLVASQTGIPSSPEDGIELFCWTLEQGQADGSHEDWVSLAPIQQRRWARFFCKVTVRDPAQRPTTLIIHPNVCIPISDTGELEMSKVGSAEHRYRPGVPRTVICPSCFNEFPVGQMLFTSYSGGEPVATRYTWIDRLLRRPPQPPKTKQGQRLTRKLCAKPDCRHDLPFTAGTQGSLVIGLIGAKFSGKSHYIASLVKRLEGQVGGDLQAALLPVTDKTHDRYQREFHEPLFGKHVELPTTVGQPEPLIYDLTLDGKLWGEKRHRAVTLALYDTAGENFDKADMVRQMVQYLRVASGIIFLVDPLQVPEVREALPPSIPLPDVDQMADPNVIVSRVLQELENGRVVAASGPLATPVAVVLTKCDVLRDAGLIDANRLWSTDKRHVGYFDTEAHDDIVGMMGEYVQRWSPAAYHTVTQRFSRHAFFGVSATGCASDQTTRRYKYISPWRVEEPLLWLLAELGVIPAR
jgi:hypothetical protein